MYIYNFKRIRIRIFDLKRSILHNIKTIDILYKQKYTSTIKTKSYQYGYVGGFSYQYNIIAIYFQFGKFGSRPLPLPKAEIQHIPQRLTLYSMRYSRNTIRQ